MKDLKAGLFTANTLEVVKSGVLILVAFLSMTSCDDFLDVKPQSEIEKEVLFSTENGFFEALNGAYVRCTDEKFTEGAYLYGDELTFGTLDVLAQNYTLNTSTTTYAYSYKETANFNYDDPDFITRRDGIWSGLYSAIGNCNLVLEYVDDKKSVFTDDSYYGLIKGEALGLRAYLHFDLLRMFAPAYVSNPQADAIPYVVTFDKEVTATNTVFDVLEKITADLLAAKELLAETDPIVTGDYQVGYPVSNDSDNLPDDGSNEQLTNELFLQNRRHRLNYFAVCASLARVYLYKNEKEKALANALEVIDSGVFPWTDRDDFTADNPEEKDRILYQELVFSWSIPEMEDDLTERFGNVLTGLSIVSDEGNTLFETGGVGAEDYRYKEWLGEQSSGTVNKLVVEKYKREEEVNLHPLMAPAIRLSEMYYIAAECLFQTDSEQAWQYFNTVRFHRGIGTEITNEPSYEFFITELLKEARKEFYAEGQIFYMYKRLNRNIVGQAGETITASDRVFVWPLPDDEIAFGGR